MREIVIEENDAGQRLDRFLNKYLPKAPDSFLQKMIRTKKIKCNHKRAEAKQELHRGDELQFYIYEEVLAPYEETKKRKRSQLTLSYVYQDGDIAIIDKPVGLLAHAASPKDYGKNVVDAFTEDLMDRGEYVPRREKSFTPAVVNRLDFNTGGLMIGVKNHRAACYFNEMISRRQIHKKYLCYVSGQIREDITIDRPLQKEGQTMRLANKEEGKTARTHVHPLRLFPQFTEAEVELETGRFHQIRAHLASIGHPLIGDHRYGSKRDYHGFSHQLLLAYRFDFEELAPFPALSHKSFQSKQVEEFRRLADRIAGGRGK